MDQNLLSAAAVATAIVSVCASELKKRSRRCWVKQLFRRRLAMGCYHPMVKELRYEDPEAFRGYLRMDIATFDELFEMVESQISLSRRVRVPCSACERTSGGYFAVPGNR